MTEKSRIGIVIPSPNVTLEREIEALPKERFSTHFTRVLLDDDKNAKNKIEVVRRMNSRLDTAFQEVAAVHPEVIAYGCTTASFIDGDQADRDFIDGMRQRLSTEVTTASRAMVNSLQAAGLSKIALFSVYTPEVVDLQIKFMEQNDLSVTSELSWQLVTAEDKAQFNYAGLSEKIRKMELRNADGIFLSCTNIPTLEYIERLQQEFGLPVYSSNSSVITEVSRLGEMESWNA